jgi:serine/threonine protein kinase
VDVLNELGLLASTDARYYTGSLVLALQYLHYHCFVHRDLKP